MNISEYKGVMVFAEQRRGTLQKVALELLGAGRAIADELREPLVAVLVCGAAGTCASELAEHGADKVVVVEHAKLAEYMNEPYTKALTAAIREIMPSVVLVGATSIGRDLAPRVSARVRTGLTADCTSLAVDADSRNLMMTRPAFGGNIMATIVCPEHRPQMATVRPGVMKKPARAQGKSCAIVRLAVPIEAEDLNVEILESVVEKSAKKHIEDANVLVSGGRGMGSKDNFAKLEKLAGELNGLVAASRGVVDSGWVAQERQVGQTGKTVRPDLYLACGISGMIQHVAGMEDSGYIVAVNKNPSAPIFEYADLGIVTDVNKLVPALIDELANARAESVVA